MDVDCEKCPVAGYCPAYKEALEENSSSYHRQNIVRAGSWDCPLHKLVTSKSKK